jgi:putative oxidoreductase
MENFFVMFYRGLIAIGNSLQHVILLVLRLIWGWMFYGSGTGKLTDIDSVISYFTQLGIPYPIFNAYTVATLEFVGGTCLLIGFASRLFALPLVITMGTAMATAHWDALKVFFSNPLGVVQTDPFSFFLVALLVFAFGPGAFSVDALIKRRYQDDESGSSEK